eukprot:2619428-Ditylum_brightwellii.AAC.1
MMDKSMKIRDVAAFFCKSPSDPVTTSNKCPSCKKCVHSLCKIWNSVQEEYICIMYDVAMKQQREKSTSPPAISMLNNTVDTVIDTEQTGEDEKCTVATNNATWKEGGSSTDMPFSKKEGPIQNPKNQKTWVLMDESNTAF